MNEINMKFGLVSIAIPAYKRTWLAEAIESALSQDYENIELIIVDDHSPQNLREVVAPYFSDKRVRYYYNEVNLGAKSIVHNWNRCLEHAQGEFFVLLCDDDILLPSFVSSLLSLVRKYPDCNVFHSPKINLYENGESKATSLWPEYESNHDFITNALSKKRAHTVTEFLYKTSFLRQWGGVSCISRWFLF